jgi:hypothetical protein
MGDLKPKSDSCGACDVVSITPEGFDREKNEWLTIRVEFGEALKLKAAVDECVRRLNNLNRQLSAGKSEPLVLKIKWEGKRVVVFGPPLEVFGGGEGTSEP